MSFLSVEQRLGKKVTEASPEELAELSATLRAEYDVSRAQAEPS